MSASEPHAPRRPDLWLVRHGDTDWARSGRHTGRTDVPLTDLGRDQGAALADALAGHPFSLVLSSPLVRAAETARLAGFSERMRIDPDLAEWDYGAFEGLTSEEIGQQHPGWTLWTDGPTSGETIAQVAARADRVIARALAAEGDVLLFAHGHLLRVLAARWLGLPPTAGRLLALSTAATSVLGWEHGHQVIVRWNERCQAT